jgi:hypothetical protein
VVIQFRVAYATENWSIGSMVFAGQTCGAKDGLIDTPPLARETVRPLLEPQMKKIIENSPEHR